MNYIKLNDFQCQLLSFNKYTNFDANGISGNCNCQLLTTDYATLHELGAQTITSLAVLYNDEVIYNLTDINAHFSYISEVLNNDHIDITININF